MIQRLHRFHKPLICLAVVVLLLSGSVFAQSATNDSLTTATMLNQVITMFSWIWVILAMGAGKLLSNEFVYGEFMNFDIYLWQMWNISKNFANLAIGLMFVFYIGRTFFQTEQSTGSEIGKKIGGFLLAGVLIQSSWFIMGALLDVEKITTSAMGALPGMVIQDNNQRGINMAQSMQNSGILGKRIHLEEASSNSLAPISINKEQSRSLATDPSDNPESILDSILPSHDNLSGPLYFIGFAMFQFHDYGHLEFNESVDLQDISRVLTGVGIKLLVVGAFSIMMLLLFVIGIIRIAYLWLVIALAPLIILYIVLEKVIGMKLGLDSNDGIMSKINIPTIFAYIFQPTIIIIFMGFMLIATTALWNGMAQGTTDIKEYGLTITTGSVEHETFFLETEGNFLTGLQNQSRNIFKDLIIMFVVFGFLLGLIVLCATLLRISFIEKAAKSLGKALAGIPMIPVWTMGTAGNNILRDTAGIDLMGSNAGKLDMKGENRMRELLGMQKLNNNDDEKYLRNLRNTINRPTQFFGSLRSWRDAREDKFALYGGNAPQGVTEALTKFIKDNDGKLTSLGFKSIKDTLGEAEVESFGPESIKDYFKNDDNKKALYNHMMGGNPNDVLPEDIRRSTTNILEHDFKPKANTTD